MTTMSTELSANQVDEVLNFARTSRESSKNFDLSLYTISYLLENKNNEKLVIGYMNRLLKSIENSEEAYTYLNKIISCISSEALFENILYWMQHIVEYKIKNEGKSNRYIIISNLIQLGKENQDFYNTMVSSLLFKIVEECISIEIRSLQCSDALACLAICLETFPFACGTMKNKIEAYLLQFLSSKMTNEKVLKSAALSFQNLQKIGSAGPEYINHKNNWKVSFERLCLTMDCLYDNFFEDIDEFCKHDKLSLDSYTLPEMSKVLSLTETIYIVENRLENICWFLKGMLENEFSFPKCIYPQYVTDVITRALSIHVCVNQSEPDNMFHFSVLLLKHQVSVLYLLRSFIAVLELSLLQFSATITKLLVDCLARTKHCNCFNHNSLYKESLYKVLEYWIKVMKNCLNTNIHDKVVKLIIDDISPIIKDLSLNMSNINNNISKKEKKKAIQSKIISSAITNGKMKDGAKNVSDTREKVCYNALCCLSTLLNHVYLSVNDSTFSLLYSTLTKVILALHRGKETLPYNSANTQLKLYEALVATIECSKPPSIGLVVNLLKDGQKTNNASISLTCSLGLNLLEKICQPVCSSWSFSHSHLTLDFNETNDSLLNSLMEVREMEKTTDREDEDDTAESHTVEEERTNEDECQDIPPNPEEQKAKEEELYKHLPTMSILEPIETPAIPADNSNVRKHPLDDSDTEPSLKKSKIDVSGSSIDIDDMLNSFVDEICENVE